MVQARGGGSGGTNRNWGERAAHSLLSSRRLGICLAGDLFAGLGADIPRGHIPIITAYLGCQAGPGGGLRQNRAPLVSPAPFPPVGSKGSREVFAETSLKHLLCAGTVLGPGSPHLPLLTAGEGRVRWAGSTPHSHRVQGGSPDGMGKEDPSQWRLSMPQKRVTFAGPQSCWVRVQTP